MSVAASGSACGHKSNTNQENPKAVSLQSDGEMDGLVQVWKWNCWCSPGLSDWMGNIWIVRSDGWVARCLLHQRFHCTTCCIMTIYSTLFCFFCVHPLTSQPRHSFEETAQSFQTLPCFTARIHQLVSNVLCFFARHSTWTPVKRLILVSDTERFFFFFFPLAP